MSRQALLRHPKTVETPAPEENPRGLRERSVYTYRDLMIDILDLGDPAGRGTGAGVAEEFYRYQSLDGVAATHRGLIVARIIPDAEAKVAAAFAESDAGRLPDLVGVVARSLFRCGDLYLHHIHGRQPIGPAVARFREHPEFVLINSVLDAYIAPYDPATWRSPADAMAVEVYHRMVDPAVDTAS